MNLSFEHHGASFTADVAAAASIAIPLDFDGPQPNHFRAERGAKRPLKLGGFVGRTRQGGSCNVDVLNLTPHCNGTHTETVSHIVDEQIWVGHAIDEPVFVAQLATVPITPAARTSETYRPKLAATDEVITAKSLEKACEATANLRPQALILRTTPNSPSKRSRDYSMDNAPAFLTVDAMQWIVKLGVRHLLVDLPSVDRMYDEGRLTNHHLFWNVPEGEHSLTAETHQDKTITEMIFVEDAQVDGVYLLSLQVPPFCSDAAPSRPIIMPARTVATA